jgi:uncharacterized protein (DUF433 family)
VHAWAAPPRARRVDGPLAGTLRERTGGRLPKNCGFRGLRLKAGVGGYVLTLPVVLVPHPHIRVEETVLGGSPFVDGSRVPVRRIYAFFRDGVRLETILKRYPQLGAAKVFDALAFALDNPEVMESDIARERAMLLAAGHRPTRSRTSDRQMELRFDQDDEDDSDE